MKKKTSGKEQGGDGRCEGSRRRGRPCGPHRAAAERTLMCKRERPAPEQRARGARSPLSLREGGEARGSHGASVGSRGRTRGRFLEQTPSRPRQHPAVPCAALPPRRSVLASGGPSFVSPAAPRPR